MFKLKSIHKTKLNKIFLCSFLALIIIIQFSLPNGAAAHPSSPLLLYEEKFSEPVTEGVQYDRYLKFTADGWFTIHLLTVDNSKSNLLVDTLIPEKGISNPEPLSSMALKSGAVAGINGDFFSMGVNTFTIGPIIKSGEFITNPSQSNMGVFSITKDNKPFIDKWSWRGIVNFPDGSSAAISGVNKSSVNSGNILMYTCKWSKNSPGNEVNNYDDYIEVVVEDNQVKEIREKLPSTPIPENGYILTGRGAGYNTLKEKLKPGDIVKVEINSVPNWQELSTAVGGGAVLIKDGTIVPEFNHNITGKHPRTAIGISEDQKILYLTVVEGRNPLSMGMDQKDLANFLLSVGAHNALNLDGGGSSVMAVRPLGNEKTITMSKLENGFERRVPNGIGVFYTGTAGELSGIKIKASSEKIPVGGKIDLEVLGYDDNYNPISVDINDIEWSVSDDLGEFEGSVFKALKSGRGVITARVEGTKHEIPIHVLGEGIQLVISPSRINLLPGQSREFKAYVKDSEGYTTLIDADVLDWEVVGDVGLVENGIFKAASTPTALSGAAVAHYGDISAVALVSIGTAQNIIEDFQEIKDMEPLSYPENVTTNFEITSTPELLFHPLVGKLKYDFSGDASTQASYTVFKKGRCLPEGTSKLGLWVYGNGGNGHWLRALVVDNTGKEAYLTLARNVDWSGWKEVECEIPSDLKQPVNLRRIYLVETEADKMDSGEIYFESLSAFYPPEYDYSLLSLETSIKEYEDPKNVDVDLEKDISRDTFRFNVFGDALIDINYNSEYYEHILKLYCSSIRDNADFLVFSGKFTNSSDISTEQACNTWLSFSQKPIYPVAGESHYSIEKSDNVFTFLDITKGGLRLTNPHQWIYLQEQLEKARGSNIFITVNSDLSAFKDQYEKQLFEDILTKYKETHDAEVWVFYGNIDEIKIDRKNGVYYVGIPGVKAETPQYISFTVKDGTVTYQIKELN